MIQTFVILSLNVCDNENDVTSLTLLTSEELFLY